MAHPEVNNEPDSTAVRRRKWLRVLAVAVAGATTGAVTFFLGASEWAAYGATFFAGVVVSALLDYFWGSG